MEQENPGTVRKSAASMKTEYVVGFMFDENYTRVALIRKTKPEWQRGLLNGIGGKVEKLESRHAAMVREFLEETGMDTIGVDEVWKYFLEMDGPDFTVSLFQAIGPLENLKSMEDEKVEIVAMADIHLKRGDMVENLHWMIGLAMDCGMDGRPSFACVKYPK